MAVVLPGSTAQQEMLVLLFEMLLKVNRDFLYFLLQMFKV